jgi:hypothetical protein
MEDAMRSRWSIPLLVVLAGVVVGCEKEDNGPLGPSDVTLASISITPATDLIKLKATETYTITALFSDGSSQVVTGSWSSDTPSIAAVEAPGRIAGAGAGQATITVEYQGLRATRTVRVVPDYHGRWEGDWSVSACSGSGDLQEICEVYPPDELFGLTLVANQTRDTITGTIDFGDDLPGPVTGTIAMDGQLSVGGTYTITVEDITLELTVSNWDTVTTDNQRMTGSMRVTGRAMGVQGSFTVDGNLRIVTKTSSQPSRAAPYGRPTFRGTLRK